MYSGPHCYQNIVFRLGALILGFPQVLGFSFGGLSLVSPPLSVNSWNLQDLEIRTAAHPADNSSWENFPSNHISPRLTPKGVGTAWILPGSPTRGDLSQILSL